MVPPMFVERMMPFAMRNRAFFSLIPSSVATHVGSYLSKDARIVSRTSMEIVHVLCYFAWSVRWTGYGSSASVLPVCSRIERFIVARSAIRRSASLSTEIALVQSDADPLGGDVETCRNLPLDATVLAQMKKTTDMFGQLRITNRSKVRLTIAGCVRTGLANARRTVGGVGAVRATGSATGRAMRCVGAHFFFLVVEKGVDKRLIKY